MCDGAGCLVRQRTVNSCQIRPHLLVASDAKKLPTRICC